MVHIPSDLVVLPTMPWPERPNELPLDNEECRTAIWMARGNITEAAAILKITSKRLRNFVKQSAYLSSELSEASEQLVDIAEKNVHEALTDEEDATRRDVMSRFVLTNLGKNRGYGTQPASSLSVKNSAGGTIVVQWADGTNFGDTNGDNSKVIDGESDAA